MVEIVRITNEEQAFACLRDALDRRFDEHTEVEFAGWPRFEMRIKGRDYDGSVPTSIMPPILDIQQDIHRAYCQVVYGGQNLRRLTKEDRDRLEIVITIERGSTSFISDLTPIFKHALQQGVDRMTPGQVTATLIVTACLVRLARQQLKERPIDGRFLVETVRFGKTPGFRVEVVNVDTEQRFTVSIAEGQLTHDQERALQTGEWQKKPVQMQINARELRGQVTRASLLSVQTLDDNDRKDKRRE